MEKMFRYKCAYKCERCGEIFFGKEFKFESKLGLNNIIINKQRNYAAAILDDHTYVELSPLESASHICRQCGDIVVEIGMSKFIGINSIDKLK